MSFVKRYLTQQMVNSQRLPDDDNVEDDESEDDDDFSDGAQCSCSQSSLKRKLMGS